MPALNLLRDLWDKLVGGIDGQAGYKRGYNNARTELIHGMSERRVRDWLPIYYCKAMRDDQYICDGVYGPDGVLRGGCCEPCSFCMHSPQLPLLQAIELCQANGFEVRTESTDTTKKGLTFLPLAPPSDHWGRE